ncbi:MAG TPA: nuclear transport factor 2 family protein [Gaiellaceae bacterium]|nr:nuclear transport factor 2 family protein [Gaiellaceae bacterium]
MDRAAFQRWLDDYVEAWRSNDADAVGALFGDHAEYRYHPWDEPVTGRGAIVASWLADPDEPGSWDARYEPWAMDGDRGVAIGVSRYFEADGQTVDREYHNVFLCRFDDGGRCREFSELFLRRPG